MVEREYKFLVSHADTSYKKESMKLIDQAYLSPVDAEVEIRVRCARFLASGQEIYWLTKKQNISTGGDALERQEIETTISKEEYLTWSAKAVDRVRKVRTVIGAWEIDEYLSPPNLIIAEREIRDTEYLSAADAAKELAGIFPDAVLIDVTHSKEYKARSLAQRASELNIQNK